MPIITMCALISWARRSASLRLRRSSVSSSCAAPPDSDVGRALNSMLNCPTSAWKTSSAIPLRTSWLRIAGACRAPTRVGPRRVVVGADEVDLHLETGERALEVEPGLTEHPAEDVQAGAQLLAVALAVRAGKRVRADFFSHLRS